jgi:hypothetical protein
MSSYRSPEDFAAKVEWEGGVAGALDYGLKHTDLDPADPSTAALREKWARIEQIYREQFEPLEREITELLEALSDEEISE